jgi:hypothetical protein
MLPALQVKLGAPEHDANRDRCHLGDRHRLRHGRVVPDIDAELLQERLDELEPRVAAIREQLQQQAQVQEQQQDVSDGGGDAGNAWSDKLAMALYLPRLAAHEARLGAPVFSAARWRDANVFRAYALDDVYDFLALEHNGPAKADCM